MNVLFETQSPTFLRLFDGAIRELVERGHRVTLQIWNADSLERPSAELAAVADRIEVRRGRPRRRDSWAALATLLRETLDYVRYLDSRLEAGYLRDRRDRLPRALGRLRRVERLGPRSVGTLLRAGLALERAIPSAPAVERLLASAAPDVVVATPLVVRPDHTDVVKSARALGVPTALAVASWDHLTTKGLIREQPDRVLVWNQAQAQEAVELHLYPSDRIRVTGAHSFDRWFDQEPSTSREEFCARAGLDPERPFLLWAGSSRMISPAPAEHAFVLRWMEALRASADAAVSRLGILVRPHPDNRDYWSELDVPPLENVALWRPHAEYAMVDADARREFFDSLFHCAAVVGINTSAMIEAAIVGRPVLTVRPDDFADTQGATLHFRYLLPENGGFLLAADHLGGHVAQLTDALRAPERTAALRARFVGSFVRPHGEGTAGSALMADAIEETARLRPDAAPDGPGTVLLRTAMRPAAAALDRSSGGLRRGSSRALRRGVRRGRRVARRRLRMAEAG